MTATAEAPARATRPPLRTGLLLGAFLAPSALGLSAAPIALPAMGADLHVSAGARTDHRGGGRALSVIPGM